MIIGINLLYLSSNSPSTSLKNIESLLNGFQKLNLLTQCTLFTRPSYTANAKAQFPQAYVYEIAPSGIFRMFLRRKRYNHNLYESYLLNKKLSALSKNTSIDLILHPFNESTTCYIKNIPNIYVIHDLFYRRHPEYYSRFFSLYSNLKHRYFVNHAAALITTTEFTKATLLDTFKRAQQSYIHVIPNAVSIPDHFTSFVPINGPYLLSIGSQSRYKNTLTLLKAYNLIKKRLPHQLVLVGKYRDDTGEIQEYIKQHDLKDRILCFESIPDEHRNSLYKNASLLVSASLSDTFSRVPIEAALLKTPVLTAKASALPEVSLGLLNYYEPANDSHALAMKMIELLKSPPTPEQRDSIANTYRTAYSDELIASRYYKLLKEL